MLIRYPGSKDRAAGMILGWLDLPDRRLCEPFCGTAAVSFAAIARGLVDQVVLNDVDRGIVDLWSTVRDRPGELVERIRGYIPDVEDFYRWRITDRDDPVENAFAMIVLHQISFSGLGRAAGSPIGGRQQLGTYLVDVRWSPNLLVAEVNRLHGLMSTVDVIVTQGEWWTCPDRMAWFVDPPYVDVGAALYRYGTVDHAALADHLRTKVAPWVLTYNDVPAVRDLYGWAHVQAGMRTYLNHGGAATKVEALITPTSQPVEVLF